jgi:hypothetical protein
MKTSLTVIIQISVKSHDFERNTRLPTPYGRDHLDAFEEFIFALDYESPVRLSRAIHALVTGRTDEDRATG